MADELISQRDAVFDPPPTVPISDGMTTQCRITIPDHASDTITLMQQPDPGQTADGNLRINGKVQATLNLDGSGTATYRLLYNYPLQVTVRPDVKRTIKAQFAGADIPGAQVTYDFIEREAFPVVTPGKPEFAVFGGDNLSLQLHAVSGTGDRVGGCPIRVMCRDGNVRFFDDNGNDVTQQDAVMNFLFADYTTNNVQGDPDYGIANIELSAGNIGIFDVSFEVKGFNSEGAFTLIVADDQIVGGELDAPRYSFSSSLRLDGPATTFVRLTSTQGFANYSKVVFFVNGIAVAPYDLTLGQLTTVGYELPKIWFTQKTIEGADPGGKAAVYYMIQSNDDDANMTRSVVKKFTTVGTVMNKPDPNVARSLPEPRVIGVTVVNQSVIEAGFLDVTIDFTNSGVPAGVSGFLTVYANGYSSRASTQIDKVQTIPKSFTTGSGKTTVQVDASLLWGFTTTANNQQSTLLIDYYLVTPSLTENSVPVSSEIEDPAQRDAGKTYSKFIANGWQLATLVSN
jgi:hypothetical protein